MNYNVQSAEKNRRFSGQKALKIFGGAPTFCGARRSDWSSKGEFLLGQGGGYFGTRNSKMTLLKTPLASRLFAAAACKRYVGRYYNTNQGGPRFNAIKK